MSYVMGSFPTTLEGQTDSLPLGVPEIDRHAGLMRFPGMNAEDWSQKSLYRPDKDSST